MFITIEKINKLWPHASHDLKQGISDNSVKVFKKYGLVNGRTVAHFMAQASMETAGGTILEENMNYSAVRLLQVFPTRFSHAEAVEYQHDRRRIADQAYNGRMGNRHGTDDGWNYRGRGLCQVTGRSGYNALAAKTGLDVVNHPTILSAPSTALECGVAEFVLCGCLPYALKDDLLGVSAVLNVGHYVNDPRRINGYSERKHWLGICKYVLGV